MVINPKRVLTAALSLASLWALAQPAPPGVRPDPLDANASVPAPVYRSSLPAPRAAQADATISWRLANETVARIGGWRSYARESQATPPAAEPAAQRAAPPASTPAAATKQADTPMPAAPGHGGHKSP